MNKIRFIKRCEKKVKKKQTNKQKKTKKKNQMQKNIKTGRINWLVGIEIMRICACVSGRMREGEREREREKERKKERNKEKQDGNDKNPNI